MEKLKIKEEQQEIILFPTNKGKYITNKFKINKMLIC
jgi:hypothetical protein